MSKSGTRRVAKRAPDSRYTCEACGLVQDPAEMQKIGWNVLNGDARLQARCLGCQSSSSIKSCTDACLCTRCRRLMVDEVKHCLLDQHGGSLILCDSCYLRDERRYGWEHRGNPFPGRLGRVVGR